jgi:hypothetical protein
MLHAAFLNRQQRQMHVAAGLPAEAPTGKIKNGELVRLKVDVNVAAIDKAGLRELGSEGGEITRHRALRINAEKGDHRQLGGLRPRRQRPRRRRAAEEGDEVGSPCHSRTACSHRAAGLRRTK